MSQIIYNAGTSGGQIVAEGVAQILSGIKKLNDAKELCEEVGGLGAGVFGDNFLAANNGSFDVKSGHGQAFNDNIGAICTLIETAMSDNTDELRNRLYSLFQG
jgi:hypothetical protein